MVVVKESKQRGIDSERSGEVFGGKNLMMNLSWWYLLVMKFWKIWSIWKHVCVSQWGCIHLCVGFEACRQQWRFAEHTYFLDGMGRMDVLWGKDWNEFKRDRSFDELIKERGNNNDGGFKICESLQVFNFLSRLRVYLEKKWL